MEKMSESRMSNSSRLTSEYRKDEEQEAFLTDLNNALLELEERQKQDRPKVLPSIHVLGIPRSGTTLLLQQLVSSVELGYVNNLIAAFWMAPRCGIRLSKKLIDPAPESTFRSHYGRTETVEEPHEFGYFWARHLRLEDLLEPEAGHADSIDWRELKSTIVDMCNIFGRPVVFKSFLLGWFIPEVERYFDRALFVYVSRDPVETAVSLLHMREEMFGSREEWASLKPRQYSWLKELPYWVQVAGQVYYLGKRFESSLQGIDAGRCIRTSLSKLQSDPDSVIEEIVDRIRTNGFQPSHVRQVEMSRLKSSLRVSKDRDIQRVERALLQFHEGHFSDLEDNI